MSTINATSTANRANFVTWTWSTKIEMRTDRESGSVARHGLVDSVENLGTGVTATDPFTLL